MRRVLCVLVKRTLQDLIADKPACCIVLAVCLPKLAVVLLAVKRFIVRKAHFVLSLLHQFPQPLLGKCLVKKGRDSIRSRENAAVGVGCRVDDGVGFLPLCFVSGFRFSLHQPVLYKRSVFLMEHRRKSFTKSRMGESGIEPSMELIELPVHCRKEILRGLCVNRVLAGAQASATLTAFAHRAKPMAAQVRKTFVVQLPADVLHVLCHVKYDLGHISALHWGAGAKSLR